MFTQELSQLQSRSAAQIKWFIVLLISCSGLGGALYGYDVGVISGAMIFLKQHFLLTDSQLGWVVGAVLLGTLIGTLAGSHFADWLGRCRAIIVGSVICIVGVGVILMAQGFLSLFTARLLLGVGTGIVSVVIPLYISEIAPAEIRGKGVAMFQLFLTLGILVAYIVDYFFQESGNWHNMFVLMFVPAFILAITMCFLPESPRWLLFKNQRQKAAAVLARLRPLNTVNQELTAIHEGLNKEEGGWRELFSAKLVWPLFISLSIAICNQLTGINVFLQYAPVLLEKAGFNSHSIQMLGTIGIGALNFLMTIVSMKLIDKLGRKKLLVWGISGILISEIFIVLVMHSGLTLNLQATLSLIGLMMFICGFAVGPGVIVWLAISELYPTKVRSKGVALGLLLNSLTGTVLSTFFLSLVHQINLANTYLLFAGFTFYYLIVARFFLPETKGKSLESIQDEFNRNTVITAQ